MNEYWNWLEESFVSNIHAQQWYNGEPPRNLSGYLNDKTNRLIGWITMRQLRVKSHQCQAKQNLSSVCEYDYSFSNEEKDSFEPGWNNVTTQMFSSSIEEAFEYKTGDELDSYIIVGDHETYSSGGYVYEFRGRLIDLQSNLSELHQLGWIDTQTRAVIIQFNLYNPNVELFTSITLLTEFLSTGGLDPQSQFQPFSFQREYFVQLSTIFSCLF
jgi:polycystin 1L2